MTWILNDLSLENNFSSIEEFLIEIEAFLNCMASTTLLKNNLLCSRHLGAVTVLKEFTFAQIVMQRAPKDLRSRILSWINKHGPFLGDAHIENDQDYFEYNDRDVTDQGLGECARRNIKRMSATSFSFSSQSNSSPLVVDGLVDNGDNLNQIALDNIWTLSDLKSLVLNAQPLPTTWPMAYATLSAKYQQLKLSKRILDQLAPLPYSITVYFRLDELCRVLEEYLDSRDADGGHTQKTEEILKNHFHGDKAWFSDDSDNDKIKFKHELTFVNPRCGDPMLITYHGKVKTPQVRMYFEWPVKREHNDIHIVYIGQKITKR